MDQSIITSTEQMYDGKNWIANEGNGWTAGQILAADNNSTDIG